MSTLTPINSTDHVSDAPSVLDANFDALNTDKLETVSNVGTGEGTIAKSKSGTNVDLKTIKAGSNVTITDNTNDITIDVNSSVVDASSSAKGVSKLSVDPVSPTNPIAVGDNDSRVPTQNENDAMVGTSGSPVSSSNKFVDNADTGTSGNNKVLRLDASGKLPAIDGSQLTNIPSPIATGNIANNNSVSCSSGGGTNTDTVVTHGLGKTPKKVKISCSVFAYGSSSSQSVFGYAQYDASGTLIDGLSNLNVNSALSAAGTGNYFTISVSVVSITSTQFTFRINGVISVGSPGGTPTVTNIKWIAE